ncbi:MAG: histidine phosphatase family protein [bacterium]
MRGEGNPSGAIRRVWVVRHGQVAENLQSRDRLLTAVEYNRLIRGSDPTPLTPEGRRQIAFLQETFRDRPIPAIHSSPLPRALETARILAEAMRVPVLPIEGLRELTPVELAPPLSRRGQRRLRYWFLWSMFWQFMPFSRKGETVWRARKRVRGAWEELLAWEPPEPAPERLVTAHRGTVMLLVSVLRREREWEVVRWSVENGGITEIIRR